MKSKDMRFHWSPLSLVSSSNWLDHRTESKSGSEPWTDPSFVITLELLMNISPKTHQTVVWKEEWSSVRGWSMWCRDGDVAQLVRASDWHLKLIRRWSGKRNGHRWGDDLCDAGMGMLLSWLEHRTITPLTQVQFPDAARDFLLRVNLQCRLSFGVHTLPCAIACINICAQDKDPAVHVRVRWIMATQTYPARTKSDENNQLDDCGC